MNLVRKDLAALPSYVPGRSIPGAIKLASNEVPFGPLPGVLEAITVAAAGVNRYPDMGVVEFRAALAERLGVPVERIATGCGSVALAEHLTRATCLGPEDEIVYSWRSFEAYPIAVQLTGATSVRVPLTMDARHDFKAMEAALTERTRAILICSPNNPTGPVVHRDELLTFLDAVPADVLVVLDEAYYEFIRDPEAFDGVEIYRDRPNVVVLRTFSKAYGLAGFRIGYAIAHPPMVAAIRKCSLPFGVSQIAQAAALASLRAEDELLERVEALVVERTRVVQELRAAGWDVPETHANFVWLPLGDETLTFAEAAQAEGVSIRPFPGEGARVTIGEREANDLFLKVACAWRR